MIGPRCSVCHHPQVAEVDAALASGAPVIPTGQAFGLSKSAIARHRTGCLAPKLAAAAKMVAPASATRAEVERAKAIASGAEKPALADLLTLQGLVARLARSLDRLEASAEDTAAQGLHGPLATLSAQLHRGIEAAAKIQNIGAHDARAAPAFSITFKLGEGPLAVAEQEVQAPVGSVVHGIVEDVEIDAASEVTAEALPAFSAAIS